MDSGSGWVTVAGGVSSTFLLSYFTALDVGRSLSAYSDPTITYSLDVTRG